MTVFEDSRVLRYPLLPLKVPDPPDLGEVSRGGSVFPRTLYVPLWGQGQAHRHLSWKSIRFSVAHDPEVLSPRDSLDRWFPHLAAHQNHLRFSANTPGPAPAPPFQGWKPL